MNRTIEYIFPEEYAGRKISDFLKDKGYTKQGIIELKFSESFIEVDGKHQNMCDLIVPGSRLSVNIRESESSEKIPPVKLPFPVVYEDEDLVVVNKPARMPSHPSLNNYENTLGNAAVYYYKSQGKALIYRCINRLDRDTTGLTIIAKNIISAGILYNQHKESKICKEYTAIVCGENLEDSGVVDLPIGRAPNSTIERMIDQDNGDRAVTHYEVIKRGKGLSLVKLRLETGRTHQIRVHMKAIGHPLIGDFLYNPEDKRMDRQALHMGDISFFQPITGERIELKAPLPEDMRIIIEGM